jgi:hypothetical protein
VALLLGCNTALLGTYGEQNQTLETFRQRVESVFQLQNSMTNDVMFSEIEPSETILKAEQQMQRACESLNEYAARESDGLSVSFKLRQRVEQTAISCEKAAQNLQMLLSPTPK